MSYKEKLLYPRWQKRRLEIFERDKFACCYCGETEKTLHVHHFCYNTNGDPWDVEDHALITLCEDCHKINHYKNFTPLESELVDFFQTIGATGREDFMRLYRCAKGIILRRI